MAEEEKKVNNASKKTSTPRKTSSSTASSSSTSTPRKTSNTSTSSSTSTPRKTSNTSTSSSTTKAKTNSPKTTNLNSIKKTSTTTKLESEKPKSASILNASKSSTRTNIKTNSTTSTQPTKPTNSLVNKKPSVKEINAQNLDSNIIAEDKEDDKKKKKKFLIIFFIILGVLALLTVGIVLITSIKTTEIKFSVSIESEVNTEIVDSNNNVIGYIEYLPGDLVDAKLKLKVQNENGTYSSSESVFLRFKIDIYVDDNYFAGLFEPIFSKDGDWTKGDDGYFYYNFKCYGNDNITVFENLEIKGSANNNVLNGKTGNLVFTAEILEGNFAAISQQWHTSPDAWRTQSSLRG